MNRSPPAWPRTSRVTGVQAQLTGTLLVGHRSGRASYSSQGRSRPGQATLVNGQHSASHPHSRIQHLVQVGGQDPQGSCGVNALLVGGDGVDAAELHALVWAHDRIGK